jgi:hypothetical protein
LVDKQAALRKGSGFSYQDGKRGWICFAVVRESAKKSVPFFVFVGEWPGKKRKSVLCPWISSQKLIDVVLFRLMIVNHCIISVLILIDF